MSLLFSMKPINVLHIILSLCLSLLLLASPHVSATTTSTIIPKTEALTGNQSSSSLSLSPSEAALPNDVFSSLSTNEEFLTVEEAYQLSIHQTKTSLVSEWMIADAYFLYGEQFQFSVNGKPVTANKSKGKISYDEIFEKDVEKHYVYSKAEINLSQLPNDKTFTLSVRYQGCADAGLCYPPEIKQFTVNLAQKLIEPISVLKSVTTTQEKPAPVDDSLELLALMILFALAGGMILNLMPCVFPVLSIKALSLANHTHNSTRIQHGWSYTIGCVSAFVVIAAVLLLIRDAGKAVGWGFQLQSPSVVTFLTFLFFIMGLCLSGLITFGGRWMNAGQSLTEGRGLSQSFFTGVLSVIVASPCTAPFMASALGYALAQPTFTALSIFAALGLGMALPFLILSYLPQLRALLPQPGAWMNTFKQALAFPLYLTSIWLLWVLGQQIGHNGVILVILGALSIFFTVWLSQHKPQWSIALLVIAILVIASTILSNQQASTTGTTKTSTSHDLWQPYSSNRLSELRLQGQPVFVNLTADWCITCKINEKLVLHTGTLEYMRNQGIHLLEGDWTNYNTEITELLDLYGRGGVPLYLFFPAKTESDAIILPQILNPATFKDNFNNI